jgi:hypothetical protein
VRIERSSAGRPADRKRTLEKGGFGQAAGPEPPDARDQLWVFVTVCFLWLGLCEM